MAYDSVISIEGRPMEKYRAPSEQVAKIDARTCRIHLGPAVMVSIGSLGQMSLTFTDKNVYFE